MAADTEQLTNIFAIWEPNTLCMCEVRPTTRISFAEDPPRSDGRPYDVSAYVFVINYVRAVYYLFSLEAGVSPSYVNDFITTLSPLHSSSSSASGPVQGHCRER
jgi:hypothetical protein